MKKQKYIILTLYIITCICIVLFSLYITKKLNTQSNELKQQEIKITNLLVENEEQKEIINSITNFNFPKNDSILNLYIPQKTKEILILRLTEEICMNCYYRQIQNLFYTYETKYKNMLDLIVLGKYRFNASLKNDIKDLYSTNIGTINSQQTFEIDNLMAPYLLYKNEKGQLTNIYIFQKGDNKIEDIIKNIIN